MAMTKLRSVVRSTAEDHRARMHFCACTGQARLHEHRMRSVHAEAQGMLQKALAGSLGLDSAPTRLGDAGIGAH